MSKITKEKSGQKGYDKAHVKASVKHALRLLHRGSESQLTDSPCLRHYCH